MAEEEILKDCFPELFPEGLEEPEPPEAAMAGISRATAKSEGYLAMLEELAESMFMAPRKQQFFMFMLIRFSHSIDMNYALEWADRFARRQAYSCADAESERVLRFLGVPK